MNKIYDVTIALPVYNAGKYLLETMLSALQQDYPSIEFLILDDCGTDNSIDIIRQLQSGHPRGSDIRVVSQEHNMGVGAARNRIIDEARGEYLFFLDADDLIIPSTITLLVKAARQNEAQFVEASFDKIHAYRENREVQPYVYPDRVFAGDEFAGYAFGQYGAVQANVWNVLMRLDLLRQCGLRFVETNYWEDMAFKFQLLTCVSKAVLLSTTTYSYICREDSLSNFQKREHIGKEEIIRNAATIDSVKQGARQLLKKPYFADWLHTMLMTDFYIVMDVLKKRRHIQPAISDTELCGFLRSPLSFGETLKYGDKRNLVFKVLESLPSFLTVWGLTAMGKTKKLI